MKKILLIEDHAVVRRNVASLLTLEGYHVVTAANGTEGVDLARGEKPDLVLCDIMMSGMDGYEVLRQLRAEAATAALPFIFLTAKGEKHDQRSGMNLGADDYLTKPAGRVELLAAIEARLTRKSQQRVNFDALLADAAPLQKLGVSEREAEVLLWIAQGKTNEDIAHLLGLSVQTVKKHVGAILLALGVENRSSAAARALEALAASF